MDIVTPAVTGAAGAIVKEVAAKAPDWLVSLMHATSPRLQHRAIQNLGNFVVRLARRVEMLETELATDQRHVFQDALDDPGTYLLIRKASVTASATENDDRHEILSELIAQRLTAGADDRVALAGSAACDAVAGLSSRHIQLLALIAAARYRSPPLPWNVASQEEYDARAIQFYGDSFAQLCSAPMLGVKAIDFNHLAGVSCGQPIAVIQRAEKILSRKSVPEHTVSISALVDQPWWPVFDDVYKTGLGGFTLTSVGMLIGLLHHDKIVGSQTAITWDDPLDTALS